MSYLIARLDGVTALASDHGTEICVFTNIFVLQITGEHFIPFYINCFLIYIPKTLLVIAPYGNDSLPNDVSDKAHLRRPSRPLRKISY